MKSKKNSRKKNGLALFNPAAEGRTKQRAEDDLGPAPCPLCRFPLVAQMGRQGTYFYCLCVRKKAA